MNGQESKEHDTFIEHDSKATNFSFGPGGVPFYIALAWVTILLSGMAFIYVYALPDLNAWVGS